MRLRAVLGGILVWGILLALVWIVLFATGHTSVMIASHEAQLRPTFDHQVRVSMGPYLPDLRTEGPSRIGVRIDLGRTHADSADELVERYGLLASRPDLEIHGIESALIELGVRSAVRAAILALAPILIWVAIGRERRAALGVRFRSLSRIRLALVGVVALLVLLGLLQPGIRHDLPPIQERWIPVAEAVPDVRVPDELAGWEVQGGLVTANTRRLVASAFSSYDRSVEFYRRLVTTAPSLSGDLRTPAEDERVAVVVSDRHDNIGMDPVVRAVADVAGATMIIDAGDDTSMGASWESFSLDSVSRAFADYRTRLTVAGNHDHGGVATDHLLKAGWTHLGDGRVRVIDDVRFFGVDDPRASGLGDWRDEWGTSFADVKASLAEEACRYDEAGERIAVVVVHDRNMAGTALARGCIDLVIAGHTHVQSGPDAVVGENGRTGYTYTNGTTGGAAYAVAVGSKIRREAGFTFVTFRDGRAVGIQPVAISTTGIYRVGEYQELVYLRSEHVGPLRDVT